MKHIFRIVIFVQVIIWAQLSQAQNPTTLVRVASTLDGKGISVKYLSPSLTFAEGVNIYRTEKGQNDFQKLNELPIKIGTQQVDPTNFDSDPNSKFIKQWLDEDKNQQNNSNGFSNLMILFQLAVSEPLALHTGIQYNDFSAQTNTDYIYEVRKIDNGKEIPIGQSQAIRIKNYQASPPLKDIVVSANDDDQTVDFKWQVEQDKIVAVHIYRSETPNQKGTRINERPILVLKSPNAQGEKVYPDIFFKDYDLIAGKMYSYTLEGIDAFGRPTQSSEAIPIQIKDTEPPAAPGKLELENKINGVSMSWLPSSSEDVKGYRIYRSTQLEQGYQVIEDLVPSTVYTDPLNAVGHYYYVVAAVDEVGNETKGIVAYVYRPDLIPPLVPSNVQAESDTGIIKLSWDHNKEVDLVGYVVFRSLDRDHGLNYSRLMITPQSQNSFIDTLPKVRRNEMIYAVAAVDTAGNMSPKTVPIYIAMPDVIPPDAPFIKNVSISEAGINIEWLPNNEPDLEGYQLFRCPKNNPDNWQVIHDNILTPQQVGVSLSANSYTDRSNKSDSEIYCYKIHAVDTTGNISAPSNIYTIKTKREKTELNQPELNLQYKKRNKAITLNWTAEQTEQLKGYIIFRKENYNNYKPVSTLLKKTEYIDKKIKSGTNYQYKVKAFYQTGAKAESNVEVISTSEK